MVACRHDIPEVASVPYVLLHQLKFVSPPFAVNMAVVCRINLGSDEYLYELITLATDAG